ncbi:MAG: AAA family ATPase, partial [Bacillota bacterium]|nr:AAA family ATPase [Bacillota bacterium]
EQEMDALSRAQAALMEAAMKFNRENDIPVPGAVSGQASEKSVSAGKASAEGDSKTEVRQQAETQQAQAEEKKPETDPMEDLNELIGLTGIKHDVRELYDFTKIQKLRKDAGMKTVPVSMHLVFTGNPGTGKTTVARILARLYKQIGVLSTGQLVECDRSGLVAGYVGQTAVKTQKKIEEAMGGVLFIDEAYSLARSADHGTDFGQEAIDTILKAMEDHRDEFVVIVAGYTKPMETFIHSNPGLQSRFNKFIEFPDYTVDELLAIFDLNCRKYEYVPDPEAREQVKTLLMLRKAQMPENFANAREVRNLFETIITNQARRIAVLEHPTKEEMQKITLEDLRDEGDSSGKSRESEKADEVEAAHEPEKTNETET